MKINDIAKVLKFRLKAIFYSFVRIDASENNKLRQIESSFPKVLTAKDTLDKIIKGMSIARFGDAEIDIALGLNKSDPYQTPSNDLTARLFKILKTGSRGNLIVCLPPLNYTTNNIPYYYRNISFWQWYWLKRFDSVCNNLADAEYGNSFVSRVSLFHEVPLSEVKKIWDNKRVVFVVGRGSRFEFDDRLFSNVLSYTFVYCKPTNAFDDYDSLLNECKSFNIETLFLIAAGPTATILAADLCDFGFQALDIGHLPNCYHEFLNERGSPESIPLCADPN